MEQLADQYRNRVPGRVLSIIDENGGIDNLTASSMREIFKLFEGIGLSQNKLVNSAGSVGKTVFSRWLIGNSDRTDTGAPEIIKAFLKYLVPVSPRTSREELEILPTATIEILENESVPQLVILVDGENVTVFEEIKRFQVLTNAYVFVYHSKRYWLQKWDRYDFFYISTYTDGENASDFAISFDIGRLSCLPIKHDIWILSNDTHLKESAYRSNSFTPTRLITFPPGSDAYQILQNAHLQVESVSRKPIVDSTLIALRNILENEKRITISRLGNLLASPENGWKKYISNRKVLQSLNARYIVTEGGNDYIEILQE